MTYRDIWTIFHDELMLPWRERLVMTRVGNDKIGDNLYPTGDLFDYQKHIAWPSTDFVKADRLIRALAQQVLSFEPHAFGFLPLPHEHSFRGGNLRANDSPIVLRALMGSSGPYGDLRFNLAPFEPMTRLDVLFASQPGHKRFDRRRFTVA